MTNLVFGFVEEIGFGCSESWWLVVFSPLRVTGLRDSEGLGKACDTGHIRERPGTYEEVSPIWEKGEVVFGVGCWVLAIRPPEVRNDGS